MSDEAAFLRELVLRQTAQIEALTAQVVQLKTLGALNPADFPAQPPAEALPKDVEQAVAAVAAPGTPEERTVRKRAFALVHGGEPADRVAERILKGIQPEV